MRVYFLFNHQHHTLLCHEMVRYWQETQGWQDFAGVVVVKEGLHYDFLQRQTDVVYHYLDTIEHLEKEALNYPVTPERLTEWERRLDIPLWHLVVADRNIGHMFVQGGLLPRTDIMDLTTHENIARFVCRYLDFFEQRLDAFQPDAVFFTALAAMPALALAKVSQWMSIPFFVLRHTRILDRHIITYNDPTERFWAVEKRFCDFLVNPKDAPPLPDAARKYSKSFLGAEPAAPVWGIRTAETQRGVRQEGWIHFGKQIGYWTLRALYFRLQRARKPERHLRSVHPFSELWLRTRQRLAVKLGGEHSAYSAPVRQEAYVLFPLHLNPEASTMILAPNFVSQLVVIEALAKNIPLTHKLYVKEHPTMIGRRPRGFYEQIEKFPNVRLLSAEEDNLQLIQHADLVTVLTGTAGWEAIMMGRPVITFGDCFYADLGFSERCSDLNQLGHQIRRLLFERNEPDRDAHRERLSLLLTAIFEQSFPFPSRVLWPESLLQPDQSTRRAIGRVVADRLARILQLSKRLQPDLHEQHAALAGARTLADRLAETVERFYAEQRNAPKDEQSTHRTTSSSDGLSPSLVKTKGDTALMDSTDVMLGNRDSSDVR